MVSLKYTTESLFSTVKNRAFSLVERRNELTNGSSLAMAPQPFICSLHCTAEAQSAFAVFFLYCSPAIAVQINMLTASAIAVSVQDSLFGF